MVILAGSAWRRKDITNLLDDLGLFTGVLMLLIEYAEANQQSKALQKLNIKDQPIQEYMSELESLRSKLKPVGW
jgi:hypothetical protein